MEVFFAVGKIKWFIVGWWPKTQGTRPSSFQEPESIVYNILWLLLS